MCIYIYVHHVGFQIEDPCSNQPVDSYHSPQLVCSCPGPKGFACGEKHENGNWDFTHDINRYTLKTVDKQTTAHSSVRIYLVGCFNPSLTIITQMATSFRVGD